MLLFDLKANAIKLKRNDYKGICTKNTFPISYIEELKSFKFSEDEIYRYLITNYKNDKDLSKCPLSKLTRDIAEELGLIDS